MQSARVFDSFVEKLFPDFYQWPLKRRTRMLGHCPWSLDPKTLDRIFHPDGRFRPDDLRRRIVCSTGKKFFERLVDVYFAVRIRIWAALVAGVEKQIYEGYLSRLGVERQWREILVIIREVVALVDYSDLCAPRVNTKRTLLLEAMAAVMRRIRFWPPSWGYTSPSRHRLWRRELQEMVRDWLEDLKAAGKDLEVYRREEVAALFGHGPSRRARWSFGSKRAGYKWSGFTVGPRREDCKLRWEWDPDVEGMVGDFWAGIEDPPLAVPGAWVDDDSASVCSDDCNDDYPYLDPYFADTDMDEDDDE